MRTTILPAFQTSTLSISLHSRIRFFHHIAIRVSTPDAETMIGWTGANGVVKPNNKKHKLTAIFKLELELEKKLYAPNAKQNTPPLKIKICALLDTGKVKSWPERLTLALRAELESPAITQ